MSRVDVHEGAGDTRNIRFNFSISIHGTIIIPDARSLEYVGDRSVFRVAWGMRVAIVGSGASRRKDFCDDFYHRLLARFLAIDITFFTVTREWGDGLEWPSALSTFYDLVPRIKILDDMKDVWYLAVNLEGCSFWVEVLRIIPGPGHRRIRVAHWGQRRRSGIRSGPGRQIIEADDGDVIFTTANFDFIWLRSGHDEVFGVGERLRT
jgi:hypothetical protein